MAVRDGRVALVGTDAEVALLKGPKTTTVALRGRLVTPGFEDAHMHLMSGARNLERVDSRGDDPDRAAERIRASPRPTRRAPGS
ncbi:MAG: amidohydrolase family protein [Holophagales bacterium]|nr:amidohydrolase family protein [Holophagales bacterium]